MEKVRIDKWLWSVRIFKSRTLSAHECKSGSVKLNGKKAKPSSQIGVGDLVLVGKNGFNLNFRAKRLIVKRVSFVLAIECYDDLTPAEELNKFKDWFIGKSKAEIRSQGAGRPTKKERREIDVFKDKIEYDLDE